MVCLISLVLLFFCPPLGGPAIPKSATTFADHRFTHLVNIPLFFEPEFGRQGTLFVNRFISNNPQYSLLLTPEGAVLGFHYRTGVTASRLIQRTMHEESICPAPNETVGSPTVEEWCACRAEPLSSHDRNLLRFHSPKARPLALLPTLRRRSRHKETSPCRVIGTQDRAVRWFCC